MIIKIEGLQDGIYAEETYENVLRYKFENSIPVSDEMHNAVVFAGGANPFSRVTLFYDDGLFDCIVFNTVGYAMSDKGNTIDVLKYDTKKANRYN